MDFYIATSPYSEHIKTAVRDCLDWDSSPKQESVTKESLEALLKKMWAMDVPYSDDFMLAGMFNLSDIADAIQRTSRHPMKINKLLFGTTDMPDFIDQLRGSSR